MLLTLTVKRAAVQRGAAMEGKLDEAGRDGGCAHYKRRCAVKAPCCGGFFVCHMCHDEQGEGTGCLVEMKGATDGGVPGRYKVRPGLTLSSQSD
jgi:hypothetical protein